MPPVKALGEAEFLHLEYSSLIPMHASPAPSDLRTGHDSWPFAHVPVLRQGQLQEMLGLFGHC